MVEIPGLEICLPLPEIRAVYGLEGVWGEMGRFKASAWRAVCGDFGSIFLGRQLFLLLFSKNFHETSTHCYSGIHFSFKYHIDPCLRCKYVLCLAGL